MSKMKVSTIAICICFIATFGVSFAQAEEASTMTMLNLPRF